MAYTLEQIEWLHDHGQMPDWAYYQQNGKSAQENWEAQHRKIMERYRKQEEDRRQKEEQKRLEAELEKQVEKQVEKAVEKALDEILKGFKFS